MKQQTATSMDILPQLYKACGLNIHKGKIVGLIAWKDGSGKRYEPFPDSRSCHRMVQF